MGKFCQQIPTAAAVSLLAMVGSARQNPPGWLAPLSLPPPAGSLCRPRPPVPVMAKARDELHLPARSLGCGGQTGRCPHAGQVTAAV